MTLYDCAVSLMHPHISNYYLGERVPGLTGNAHSNLSPYEKFQTRTTEIFLGAGNNRAFRRLCSELGLPALADDPRFKDNRDRLANRDALSSELSALMAEADGFELCHRLLASGLAAGPVMATDEVMNHPHTRHRKMAVEHDGYRSAGVPIKFSRTPGEVRSRPPRYGVDARDILTEHGFPASEIETLIKAGIVLEARRPPKS